MNWRYIFDLSYQSLVSRKGRTLLTIGGVGIGISAIVFLVSLGYGLQRLAITETIGTKSLNVLDVSAGTGAIRKIDAEVINRIRGLNNVQDLYPQLETPARFGLKDSDARVDLIAFVNNDAFTRQTDMTINRGRFAQDGQREAVITESALSAIGIAPERALNTNVELKIILARELMPRDRTGELEQFEVRIVGIIADNENPYILMPIAPAKEIIGDFSFTSAKVRVNDAINIDSVRSQAVDMGLEVEYIGDTVRELENIFGVVRIILSGFGLVATLVAALGMFNTLSVSLLERTREIGIMKTFGARKSDVWRLFLIEGLIISVLGGVVGILLGVTMGELLNIFFNLIAVATNNPVVDFYYSPPLFLASILGLVFLIGLAVGLIPARRATKISPLNALRYE